MVTPCPRCGYPLETASLNDPLPAYLECPACGLTIEELRTRLEAGEPRETLESDVSRVEGVTSQRHGLQARLH
jgi:hypothetical protein